MQHISKIIKWRLSIYKSMNKLHNREIAYFIGAMQTDGCLTSYLCKSRDIIRYKLYMGVGSKSLPMLKK